MVEKCREHFWDEIRAGVQILFANRSEAAALLKEDIDTYTAHDAIMKLKGTCHLIAVTDGSKGSYLSSGNKIYTIPPCWIKETPIDTCGAGDVYAAGIKN